MQDRLIHAGLFSALIPVKYYNANKNNILSYLENSMCNEIRERPDLGKSHHSGGTVLDSH